MVEIYQFSRIHWFLVYTTSTDEEVPVSDDCQISTELSIVENTRNVKALSRTPEIYDDKKTSNEDSCGWVIYQLIFSFHVISNHKFKC